MELPESDWRLLRTLHRVALDRYCARVLGECAETMQGEGSPHDRYLRVYRLLKERDKSLATAFNDLRRSTAIQRLAGMISLGVVTTEEQDQFSGPTRDILKFIAGL